MISSSELWKKDIAKLEDKILRRIIQTRWTEKSIHALEKELFYGFFSIRKLIELRRVSEEISTTRISITDIPLENAPSILEENPDTSKMVVGAAKKSELSIKQICNQFIHSERILPLIVDKHFIGVLVCSDHKRKSGIYMITVFDISSIYKKVGLDVVQAP